jgi:hypothetical protein
MGDMAWRSLRGPTSGMVLMVMTSPCRVGELHLVADRADHRPLGSNLIKVKQQELSKTSACLMCPKTGSTGRRRVAALI